MNGLKIEVEDSFCIPEEYNQIQENVIDNAYVNCSPDLEQRSYSLPSALSEHFSVQREVGDGTISGMCHSCGATLKFTIRATSNLITHLKRCDPSRYEMYCQNRKCKRARRGSPVGFGSVLTQTSTLELFRSTPEINNGVTEVSERADSQSVATTNEFYVSKPIMKHFKMCQLTPHGNITARCLNCGADVKASVKASSNLITHLKRCSPIRFERYCRDRGGKRSSRCWQGSAEGNISTAIPHNSLPQAVEDGSSGIPHPFPQSIMSSTPTEASHDNTCNPSAKRTSPAIHSADRTSCHQMFGASQSKQRKMVKSLVLSAASDHVSYETILKPNVRNFISEADNSFVIPDLNTMNSVIIPLCAQKIREKITSELQHLDLLYLKVTLWSDKNSVTHASFQVSFINDDWGVVERHLGNYATKSKLKPSSLVLAIDDVAKRFKINAKVKKILLDNTIPFVDDVIDFQFVTSQCSSKNLPDNEFSTLLSFLPETIASVTQRLSIIAMQSLSGDDTSFSPISVALKKAVNLIVALSETSTASEYLEQYSIVISGHDTHSWVSVLDAVALIYENLTYFEVALDLLEPPYNDSLALTVSELEILKEVSEIFNPFVTTMKYLVEEKLYAIAPVVKGLIKSLDSLNISYLRHCVAMRSRVIVLVKIWLEPFLTSDDIAIASFLDPRFKLNWLETQSDKDALLMKVKALITRLNISGKNPGLAQSSVTENCGVINTACQYYLSEPISPMDTDPLLYWKCCPTTLLPLALLARIILVCMKNFSTGETLDNISAWEKCYQVFSDDELRGHLSFIDRNKDLFQSSL